jgi:hypothetical protein
MPYCLTTCSTALIRLETSELGADDNLASVAGPNDEIGTYAQRAR